MDKPPEHPVEYAGGQTGRYTISSSMYLYMSVLRSHATASVAILSYASHNIKHVPAAFSHIFAFFAKSMFSIEQHFKKRKAAE